MAGIRFDFTGDNASFIKSVQQIQESVQSTTKTLGKLGDGFNVGNVIDQIDTLTTVIRTNEQAITKSKKQIADWMKQADEARGAGDFGLADSIQLDITQALNDIEEYNKDLQETRAALLDVMNVGNGEKVPMLFDSQADYDHVQELKQEIIDLQEQIADKEVQFAITGGTDEELENLRAKLSETESELNRNEEAAMRNTESLGATGAAAAEASNYYYKLTNEIKEQEATVAELTVRFSEAEKAMKKALAGGDMQAISNARMQYDAYAKSLGAARQQLIKTQAEQEGFHQKMQKMARSADENGSQIKDVFKSIGALAGVSFTLSQAKQFVNEVVSIRSAMQDLETSAKIFLGSEEAAANFNEQLKNYSMKSLFHYNELMAVSQQLLGIGLSSEEAMKKIDQLANIAAATHASLSNVVSMYTRAQTMGSVMNRQLVTWQNLGVNVKAVLTEMGEDVSKSTVSFEQLQKVIDHVTAPGGKFANAQSEMLGNISAEIDTYKNEMELMFNEIGEKYQQYIIKAIQGGQWLIENYKEIGRVIMDCIAAYGSYRAALIAVAAAHKVMAKWEAASRAATLLNTQSRVAQNGTMTASAVLWTQATRSIKANTLAMLANTKAALTNPYVLLGAAVAALTFAIYKANTAADESVAARQRVNDAIDSYNEKLNQEQQKGQDSISVIQNKTASLLEQTRAYKDLIAEHEIFAQYSKEEIANMDVDQLNNIWSEEKAKKQEEYLRNYVAATQELKEEFKNGGASWATWWKGDTIDEVAKKYNLTEEDATKLKDSVSGNMKEWADASAKEAADALQQYLAKEAENGVAEGLKKGFLNSEAKAQASKVLEDYASAIKKANADAEKAISERQAKIDRINSGEEKVTNKKGSINGLNTEINVIRQTLVETRGEIGKTFSGSLSKQAEDAQKKVELLGHELANAAGTRKAELAVELQDATNERNALQSILKLMEAGKLDAELVLKISRESENAQLGDEKLVEIGKGYEEIDDKVQHFMNALADAKKEMEKNSIGEAGSKSAEEIEQAWKKTSDAVINDLTTTENTLTANIEDLKREQDGLKEKFGDTYKDTAEYRKLELEITRKQEQLGYLKDLKNQLIGIAKNPFSIWIDIKAKVSDKVKSFLRNYLSDDVYKKFFGDEKEEEKKDASTQAKEDAKNAQDRINFKKTQPGPQTGAQWSKTQRARKQKRLKKINEQLSQPIDEATYNDLIKEKQQLESDLKKGSNNDKQAADRQAKERQQVWKHAEEMAKMERDLTRAREDAKIAAIKDGAERERATREAQHRRTMEDLKAQENDIYKTIYNERKQKFESDPANKNKRYENDAVGSLGYGDKGIKGRAQQVLKPVLDQIANIDKLSADGVAGVQKQLEEIDISGVFTDEEAKVVKGRLDAIISNASKANSEEQRQSVELARQRRQELNDYIKEYGSIQEQRAAVTREFDDKIAQTSDEVQKAALRKQRENVLSELNFKELQNEIDWETVFGDLTRLSNEELGSLKDKLRAALSTKDLDPTDIKTITDAINQISDAEADNAGLFESMMPYYRERKRLIEESVNAQLAYDAALRQQQEAQQALEQSQGRATEALNTLGVTNDGQAYDLTQMPSTEILDLIEQLRPFGDEAQNAIDALSELATASTDAAKAEQNVKDKQGKRDKKEGERKGFSSFKQGFQDAVKQAGGVGNWALGQAQQLPQLAEKLGLGKEVTEKLNGAVDIGNAAMKAASGNYIGAAMDAVSGITSLFSDDHEEEYQKALADNAARVEANTYAINQLTSAMVDKSSSAQQRLEDREAARSLVQSSVESIRASADLVASDSSGKLFGGYHSWMYKRNNAAGAMEDIAAFNKALQEHGSSTRVYSANDVVNHLSAEEIQLLRTYASSAWADYFSDVDSKRSPAEVKNYLEQIGELAKKDEEIMDKWYAGLTNMTFEQLRDNYKSTLLDMKSDTSAFMDDFDDMFVDALADITMETLGISKSLKKFQEKWAGVLDDGDVTDAEYKKLRKEYEAIAALAKKGREQILSLVPDYEGTSSSSSASGRSFQTMSQEAGDELSGRFTAMLIASNEISATSKLILANIASMSEVTRAGFNSLQELAAVRNDYLQTIMSYNKKMYDEWTTKLNDIANNTSNI